MQKTTDCGIGCWFSSAWRWPFLKFRCWLIRTKTKRVNRKSPSRICQGPIKRALKDLKVGQVSEIERERRGSRTVYEVELRVGKQEVELRLNPDGKLLGVEIEQRADDDDDDDDDR